MQTARHRIILSSGREIHCLGPNIGISLVASGGGWRITTGYDDVIHTQADGSWHDDALSHAEAREIAEHMIRVWTEYREGLPGSDSV